MNCVLPKLVLEDSFSLNKEEIIWVSYIMLKVSIISPLAQFPVLYPGLIILVFLIVHNRVIQTDNLFNKASLHIFNEGCIF